MRDLRPLAAWLVARRDALSARERALLATVAACTVGLSLLLGVRAALDDLGMLRARVAGLQRELVQVRRLAARVRRDGVPLAPASNAPSLVTRLEAAAADAVGRERIASMTPGGAPGAVGEREDRMALRVVGASLPEVVHLLHALEGEPPALVVTRLELRKHPDDPTRFDATVEVARPTRPAP